MTIVRGLVATAVAVAALVASGVLLAQVPSAGPAADRGAAAGGGAAGSGAATGGGGAAGSGTAAGGGGAADGGSTAADSGAASDAIDWRLSLHGDAWSGSRRLDDAGAIGRASAWGRAKVDLGAAGSLVGDGWLAAQTRDTAPGQRGRLRELYWQGSAGRVDWKVGRQNIVWGRADGLNPTDNLSARDFTLLAPEDNDQRRGNAAVQLRLDTGFGGTLTGIWFPRTASHVLPLPALPQTTYAVGGAPHKPQVALKLDVAAAGVDGSLSYFRGSDPVPDLSVGGIGAGGLQVLVRNNPLRVWGADLSATQGDTVWRAEAAWMTSDHTGADDFVRKKNRLWLIAGGEWALGGNATLGLQASLQHVMNFRSPDDGNAASPVAREVAWRSAAIANQTSANQLGVIWRLAGRWAGDTLTAETSGVAMGGPRGLGKSGIWRTKFGYAISDRLQLQAGSDVYFGPEHSLWGQFRRNRLVYAQLRYGL